VLPSAATGLALSVATSRWLESQLFGVTPLDPATFGASGSVLVALALLAALFPAIRAGATDPMTVLRRE
jgi:putative ABC transport system permease protein